MMREQGIYDIIKWRKEGNTWEQISEKVYEDYGIKVHRTTIQRWHDRSLVSVQDFTESEGIEDTFEDKIIKSDRRIEYLKSEASFYRKLYNTVTKQSAKEDLLLDIIHDISPSFKEVPKIPYKQIKGKAEHSQTVIAPLTDTHIGEYINEKQMIGMNKYDMELFNKRLYGWANQLLALVNYRRNIANIDTLIVPMLGDMISGDIHDELARSNVENNMMQMLKGAYLISQAILLLAPHFKEIKIPCVVGNHGRMSYKPVMKNRVTTDWDYMLYQWIAAFLKNQKHIKFEIPESFFHIFNVYNNRILIMHGDSIAGGGSSMSISKAVSNLRGALQYKNNLNIESGLGTQELNHFDTVFMGHFHRVDEMDIGTGELHICGCIKGVDEFALQRLHVSAKPKQIATYWHPLHGYLGKEVIYLSRYDQSDNKFDDNINSTWANMIF